MFCRNVPKQDGYVMKSSGIRRGKKRMSQLQGKLRQKVKNGACYYRLMVASGVRKEFALKTNDCEEACRKAADLDTASIQIASANMIAGG